MKNSIKTLLAVGALAACGALTACAPKPQAFKFEAEQATFEDAENQADNNLKVESAENASNGYSVGYFTTTGQKLIWTVTSDRDVKGCELVLGLAAAKLNFSMENGQFKMSLGDTELGANYTLTNNGTEISLGDVVVSPENPDTPEGAYMPDFHQFKDYKFTIDLVKGENKIVLEKGEGQDGVNVDYLQITAGANLTFTAAENELPEAATTEA